MACSGGGDDGNGSNTPSGGSEYLDGRITLTDPTTATLSINASQNCQWSIEWSDSAILSVSPKTGRGSGEATIKLEENPSYKSERKMALTLTNANKTITRSLTITQQRNSEYIKLSPDSLAPFSYTGGHREVIISSNTTWKVSLSKEWVKCNIDKGEKNGTVEITAEANNTKEEREAEVVFKGESVTVRLSVKQDRDPYATFTTLQVSNVKNTSAVVKFSYTSGSEVTSYGVCYAKTDNPDINASGNVSETGTAKQGSPSLSLTGLEPNTKYYVRAFVFSTVGYQYSESISFTTKTGQPESDDNVTPNI